MNKKMKTLKQEMKSINKSLKPVNSYPGFPDEVINLLHGSMKQWLFWMS
jgi:hypothetical protein